MALDFENMASKQEFSKTRPLVETSGKPLDLPLIDVAPDPNQPRTDFDETAMKELADDILDRGVKAPISVRSNPNGTPPYMINFGARRYEASKRAGKTSIPAFVDENFDSYDQVAENEKRRGLSVIELAMFVTKRRTAGDAQEEIGRRLGKGTDQISMYQSIAEGPDFVATAFSEQRISAVRAGAGLVKLYKKHPDAVEAFCRNEESITVKTVEALAARLKPERKPKKDAERSGKPEVPDGDQSPPTDVDPPKAGKRITTPVLSVTVDGKQATAVLDRVPGKGKLFVLVDGETDEVIVKAKDCQITQLSEARR